MNISFEKKKLDLKVNWKIARNEALYKENYICTITNENRTGRGECAPNIRYGETQEKIQSEINDIAKIKDLNELKDYLIQNEISHSLECAINNALFFFELGEGNVFEYLKIPKPVNMKTSYSLPILTKNEIVEYVEKNNQYHVYKIKIKNENDFELVKTLSDATDKPIRIDANEGFDSLEAYLAFESKLVGMNIELIEQPFRASMTEAYRELKHKTTQVIIADESIEKDVNFDEIAECFHGVNIKLQKCAGIQNAFGLIVQARKRNLKVMIGCMIETSLGISHGLVLGAMADYLDLDGSLLLKNDPFEYIIEKNGYLNLSF
jgi:L-alanine-DL-glutamate epimerase-like enolase superfamily enzyme